MGLRPDQDIVADDCGVARRPRITAFSITMLRRGPTLISPVLGGQHGPDGTRASGSMRTAPPQRWLPGGSRRSPRFGRGADDVVLLPAACRRTRGDQWSGARGRSRTPAIGEHPSAALAISSPNPTRLALQRAEMFGVLPGAGFNTLASPICTAAGIDPTSAREYRRFVLKDDVSTRGATHVEQSTGWYDLRPNR